jgi:hypothetical protein
MRTDDLFDLEYGYWFNLSNERFYRHLDTLLNLVQLVGGSAAAIAALQKEPQAVVVAGIALALCAAVALLVQPGIKAEQHRVCKAAFRTIKGAALSMADDALHRAVTDLQGSGPLGLAALAVPSYNAAVCATGREDQQRPVSWGQALVSAI